MSSYEDYVVNGPTGYGEDNVFDSLALVFPDRSDKKALATIGQDYTALNEAYNWALKNKKERIGDICKAVPSLDRIYSRYVRNKLRARKEMRVGLPITIVGQERLAGGGLLIKVNKYEVIKIDGLYAKGRMFSEIIGPKILRFRGSKEKNIWRLGWKSAKWKEVDASNSGDLKPEQEDLDGSVWAFDDEAERD